MFDACLQFAKLPSDDSFMIRLEHNLFQPLLGRKLFQRLMRHVMERHTHFE